MSQPLPPATPPAQQTPFQEQESWVKELIRLETAVAAVAAVLVTLAGLLVLLLAVLANT
jgi:hypothetical protein